MVAHWPSRSWWPYLGVVAAVLVGAVLPYSIPEPSLTLRLFTLVVAVVLGAGGMVGPTLFGAALAVGVAAYHLPPDGTWWIAPGLPRFIFGTFVAALLILIGGLVADARRRRR